jgi:aldehyde:ferredoxin oxidoreductase
MVLCRFSRNVYTWDRIVRLLDAITGFGYTVEDLRRISNRIQSMIRLYNIRCGVGASEDTISRRFFEEPVAVARDREVTVSKEELEAAVKEYYRLRGWSTDGIPLEEF